MKQNILHKSKELFLKNGFKTVGMDDIATALGISKKTIYQHFSSKDELVEKSLHYTYDLAMEKMNALSGTCQTPIHEHYEIYKAINELLEDKISYTPSYQLKKYYPELAQKFQEKRYTDVKIIINKNLEQGLKQGYYRKNLNKDFISTQFIIGSFAFFYKDDLFNEEQPNMSFKEFDEHFLEYYLRAIVSPKGLEILENIIKQQ